MRSTFATLALACAAQLAAACNTAEAPRAPRYVPEGEPMEYRARIVRVSGASPAQVGARCLVEVIRLRGGPFDCRVRIACGDDLVYGLSGSGYNTCRVDGGRVLGAVDGMETRRDGDPKLRLDLEHGVARIIDRDPDVLVELAIEGLRPPPDPDLVVPEGYGETR